MSARWPVCRQWTRLEPEHTGCDGRINPDSRPPCGFIAVTMDLAMMSPAQWHRELIADFAAQRPALGKAQVWASHGWRPQIRQGCWATNLTWSRSRMRRGSGCARTVLSMGFVRDFRFASGAFPLATEDDRAQRAITALLWLRRPTPVRPGFQCAIRRTGRATE